MSTSGVSGKARSAGVLVLHPSLLPALAQGGVRDRERDRRRCDHLSGEAPAGTGAEVWGVAAIGFCDAFLTLSGAENCRMATGFSVFSPVSTRDSRFR